MFAIENMYATRRTWRKTSLTKTSYLFAIKMKQQYPKYKLDIPNTVK
jgi:hypothetical protein